MVHIFQLQGLSLWLLSGIDVSGGVYGHLEVEKN